MTTLVPTQSLSAIDVPSVAVTALWETKYVSEGRDNFEDGGLFSVEAVAEWEQFLVGGWYGVGETETYQELNIFAEYGLSLGPLSAYVGVTRLEFIEDDEHDHELGAGVGLALVPWVTPAVDVVYSTESEGTFVELSLTGSVSLPFDLLAIEPHIVQSIDFGYASDDHDGVNNLQLGIDLSYAFMPLLSFTGGVYHSIAQKDVENDGLGDETWGALGISGEF